MTRNPVSQALVIIKQGIATPPAGDALAKRITPTSPAEQAQQGGLAHS
ncbi:MAG: hypothetical protein M5U23_03070 [Acidimicrobiia bacterium]|nr:hypothetical protein [Acidimicrobiia bacterium]